MSCATSTNCAATMHFFFFFSSRRRHTRLQGDWSSDVCSSDLIIGGYEHRRRVREREQVLLEAELVQRQLRESELSQALVLERRVRQEQRDFVAMVSHELRTPLAIILTSAQIGRASCRERV